MKDLHIIEDDPSLRQLLHLYFSRQDGIRLHLSAEPLLCPLHPENAPAEPPACDFLLVDNQLPVMTGLEFVRRHGRTIRHKAVMSANLSAADLALARELGCRVFRKPFPLKEITDWISTLQELEYSLTA